MSDLEKTVLVFGATGQQGGAVADALCANGWHVRALVRDVDGDKARSLLSKGIELVRGDLADGPSISAAMDGVYGVFSVQPSSGQGAVYGVSDEDEIRYGSTVADAALAAGVQHLVYSSAIAAGPTKTGMGHFDSKAEIEAHIRGLGIRHTIIRPTSFMEILMLPGLGLDQGMFNFILRPDQPMQFIAVEDIGKIVAAIFADPDKFADRTIGIAGDAVTGGELQEKLSRAAGKPISYHRFPDSLLEQDAFLGRLAALIDDGRLAGNADLAALRQDFRSLLSLDQWLSGAGKPLLAAAIQAEDATLTIR